MRRKDEYPALKAWRWLVREVKSTRYGGEECGLIMEWVWGLLAS